MFSIQALVYFVVWLVVVGLILWLLQYLISAVPMPEPFRRVANVAIVVVAVLAVIVLLLSLVNGVPVLRP